MTQEEKQLLLKDLCARLPYGVVIHTDYEDIKLDRNHCGIGVLYYEHYNEEAKKQCGYDENHFSIILSGCYYGDNIKPYLHPMSSMTEEEREEYDKFYFIAPGQHLAVFREKCERRTDWLNAHHFDYRGLIEKGLAIEAPEDMYKEDN